jgi:hypothetical protein
MCLITANYQLLRAMFPPPLFALYELNATCPGTGSQKRILRSQIALAPWVLLSLVRCDGDEHHEQAGGGGRGPGEEVRGAGT